MTHSAASVNDLEILPPRVTVVVVTFEGRKHIANCVRSLMSATAEQAEVVVIDNASTDGTTELVSHEFPWVRIIKSERNVGYGSACNTAAAQSKAEYIAVVNQDVISTLGWIDHQCLRQCSALHGHNTLSRVQPPGERVLPLGRGSGRIGRCVRHPP